jgi:hypothetical protein
MHAGNAIEETLDFTIFMYTESIEFVWPDPPHPTIILQSATYANEESIIIYNL